MIDWVISGTCALEDGTPFPGVLFVPAVRDGEGAWKARSEAAIPVDLSPEPAAFEIHGRGPSAPLDLLVLGGSAKCVAADGAEIVGEAEKGEVLRFTPGVEASLRFRWMPGKATLLVRSPEAIGRLFPTLSAALEDGEGRALPVENDSGRVETGRISAGPGDLEREVTVEVAVRPLPRRTRRQGDRRVLVLSLSRHEPIRIPVESLAGCLEVEARPGARPVTGFVSPPPGKGETVRLCLEPASGEDPRPDSGRGRFPPTDRWVFRDGSFYLNEVPPGDWVLKTLVLTAEGMRWGRRTFRREGDAPLELGAIETTGGTGMRCRLLDGEGRAVPGAPLRLERLGEERSDDSEVVARWDRGGERGGLFVLKGRTLHLSRGPAEQDPRPADPEGWYEVPDLAPATRYRVRDGDFLSSLSEEVTTSAEPGAWVEVELRRPREGE
ncbi:MAG: hypothetical protein HUU06_13465 [Planctomycetaceae bacterium]|nr:hypothetical protein [Planctomycetaceae bacterium]